MKHNKHEKILMLQKVCRQIIVLEVVSNFLRKGILKISGKGEQLLKFFFLQHKLTSINKSLWQGLGSYGVSLPWLRYITGYASNSLVISTFYELQYNVHFHTRKEHCSLLNKSKV